MEKTLAETIKINTAQPTWKIVFKSDGKESLIDFPNEDWHIIAKVLHEILLSHGVKSVLTVQNKIE
jgi:hypothetical protein